jgi:hypothetical protein
MEEKIDKSSGLAFSYSRKRFKELCEFIDTIIHGSIVTKNPKIALGFL